MSLCLYDYYRSSSAYRVRIALNLKGVEHELKNVNLLLGEHKEGDYLSHNKQGLVPALQDESFKLTQSMAMLEYLEEKYPTPALLPQDIEGRARVRQLSNIIAGDIHPVNNLRILKYLKTEMHQEQGAVDKWYRHWVDEGFRAFEQYLEDNDIYCHGNQVTLADVVLMPQIYNARRFKVEMSAYPNICKVEEALFNHSAFIKAHPDNHPHTGSNSS